MLAKLRAARSATGRELKPAVLRVLTVGGVSVYLLLAMAQRPRPEPIPYGALGLVWLGALALLLAVLVRPRLSVPRRAVSIGFDTSAISTVMYLAGPVGAPLYPLYLLLALGNGFRFGISYLYLSTALAVIGYSLVIASSPYWLNQLPLAIGLTIGLGILPLYAARFLQRQRENARRTARISRSKARLLGNITQELRKPLHHMTGMSDLLRETPLNREQRGFAEAISHSAGSLGALIENMADYSTIEAGKLAIAHTDFDLHSVLNGTVRVLQPQTRNKGLQLNLQFDPKIPFQLRGDPNRLRQILTSLLSDVINRMQHGSIGMRVHLQQTSDTRIVLRFELETSPSGAFTPQFAQCFNGLDDAYATESVTDCAGLAVAIARELIDSMQGKIEIGNETGQTGLLAIELPFERQADAPTSVTTLDGVRALLIADDRNPDFSRLTGWLRDWHVHLDAVESASAAFVRTESEFRRKRPYHAIIIDQSLVENDARQFAQALRKTAMATNCVLVLIAPQDAASQQSAVQNAGYNCMLSSPVEKPLLHNALHSAAALQRTAASRVIRLRTRKYEPRAAKARILVAEDNPTSQKFVAGVLDRAGHEVDVVQNGEEALDALEVKNYQLVIVDMHMPIMDGIQTAKLYRFIHPGRTRVPFVMLTANATAEARMECESAGIETFLTKPIEASRLVQVVDRLLSGHARRATGHDANRHRDRAPTADPLEAPPVLNLSNLQEVQNLGYGSDFFHELIQGFIRDGNSMLEKMSGALACQDYADFRDAGLALKGNAGSMGAVRLYKSCHQIERMSRVDYELMGGQLVNDIRAEFLRACSALIEYSKQLGNNARS